MIIHNDIDQCCTTLYICLLILLPNEYRRSKASVEQVSLRPLLQLNLDPLPQPRLHLTVHVVDPLSILLHFRVQQLRPHVLRQLVCIDRVHECVLLESLNSLDDVDVSEDLFFSGELDLRHDQHSLLLLVAEGLFDLFARDHVESGVRHCCDYLNWLLELVYALSLAEYGVGCDLLDLE